ncbi:carboxypeptidase-like regulatory domain-containing protein [Chondrinema litorale]|uniref:carboxypeptidase-like regulatory domain-containing protein n=1 Tax=Chondrinema litorale TaxID=2994555 RepID=UPI0025435959|nr:carboxypeptidase-like regulatory domain-containing protein [Chondrinema litorale]UZR93031.1 carboxypeptidase-like regulatory domain-containing protein [Chondrinema litorale]
MKYLIIIIYFLSIPFAYSQYEVKGRVFDASTSEPLPGVSIMEMDAENVTTTDLEGNYSFTCRSDSSIIQFSYIGYNFEEEIASNVNNIDILMEADKHQFDNMMFCYSTINYFRLGFQSGVNYTPIGLKLSSFLSSVWRFNPMLYTDIEWRTDRKHNRYLNLSISRRNLFKLGNANVALSGAFKQFKTENEKIQQWNFAPEFHFKKLAFSSGYAYQEFNNNENWEKYHGVSVAIYKSFLNQLYLKLGSSYIADQFQYDFRLTESIPRTNISVGLGYERLRNYNEFTLSVLYKIRY